MTFKKINDISGVILAGGRASRMKGVNKALITIEGQKIVQTTVALFESLFDEIIIVTNSPDDFKEYSDKSIIVGDLVENIGPLGGMHAALSNTEKEALFFVACDMPFLHNETIVNQINCFNTMNCDALVPRIGQKIEPLHSIFSRKSKTALDGFINNSYEYSLRKFLKLIKTEYWDLENIAFYQKMFCNLNTLDDVEKIKDSSCR